MDISTANKTKKGQSVASQELLGDSTAKAAIYSLVGALAVTFGILLFTLTARGVSGLTIEILAAVLGAVIVIASVAVTIHFQYVAETERQYRVEVFRHKVQWYMELIDCIVAADDDDVIDDVEVEAMWNHARRVSLVASANLVGVLAQYVARIDRDRALYFDDAEPTGEGTLAGVLAAMRTDLAVVREDISGPLSQMRWKGGRREPGAGSPPEEHTTR